MIQFVTFWLMLKLYYSYKIKLLYVTTFSLVEHNTHKYNKHIILKLLCYPHKNNVIVTQTKLDQHIYKLNVIFTKKKLKNTYKF